MKVVDSGSVSWTEEERILAVAVLKKIALCQDMEVRIPGDVFEAHAGSKKNISTEMVLFNPQGQVYLIERPSLEENPSEPYPGELHSPGVTHTKNEFTEPDTFRRLVRSEFGGIDLPEVEKIGERDTKDDGAGRAMYRLIIYTATVDVEPVNSRGRFYDIDSIPWHRLVRSHREVLLPLALRHHARE